MLMGTDRNASSLFFDSHVRLNNNVDGLAINGQESSVADNDKKATRVLGKNSMEGENRRVVNLTCAHDRRREVYASAISEILKTTSPINEDNAADMEKVEDLNRFLVERDLDETFVIHIPNFQMDHIARDWNEYVGFRASLLSETGHILLYLLRFFFPLTAAYGGIHLSAWNFEFPSRVKAVIWRTACFIIVGSSFAIPVVPSWSSLYGYFVDPYQDPRQDPEQDWKTPRGSKLMGPLIKTVGFGLAGLLLLCYAASRLYLVVESFLSLRQVPIGVYAAVPWVENIPHV